MDFSVLPGKTGYYLWKFGIIKFGKSDHKMSTIRRFFKQLKTQSVASASGGGKI